MTEGTNIKITRETKAMLDELGHKGDSYDDIVRRLAETVLKAKEGQKK